MLTLSIIQGPDQGKKFALPQHEPQLFGRSSEALPISDTTVSRRHAELTPEGDTWYLRDLNSQNGTFVNGVQITMRTPLRRGDQIRIGRTVLVFGSSRAQDASVVRVSPGGEDDIRHRLRGGEDTIATVAQDESSLTARVAAEHLRVVYQLVSLTSQGTDLKALLESVMDLVFSVFRPERGALMVYDAPEDGAAAVIDDDQDRPLHAAVVRYRDRETAETDRQIFISRSILRYALSDAQGVLSSNTQADPRFASGDSISTLNIRSAICSPIRFQERTFGAIYVDTTPTGTPFTTQQLSLMNALAHHTGLAMANAEKTRQMIASERLVAMGETVASLSHSIRNILQGMQSGADLVEMGLRRSNIELSHRGWPMLKRNLDRIVVLTRNMLAFGKRRQIEVAPANLGSLLEDAASLYERAARQKNVALIVDADPDMPEVSIDAELLHQAILNLIGNAIDAVDADRGVVTITARYQPEPWRGEGAARATIRVSDNGPGIPQDRLGWIFEPFNTTKGIKGTGLGLPVTRRIISDHGGTIDAGSGGDGGAQFTIELPVLESAPHDPSKTSAGGIAAIDQTE